MRAREVPRARRAEARALLVEAFAALESGAATLDLLRRVDALAAPRRPLRLHAHTASGPRIGARLPRGAVDRRLVARVWSLRALATRIDARVERFLMAAGFEEQAVLGVKPPVPGPGLPHDLELPEG